MRMKLWFSVALTMMFMACSADINSAKKAVEKNLKDPSSAQYRNLISKGGMVCGEVNSKNSMGGYAGFEEFTYFPPPQDQLIMGASRAACQ